MNICGKFPNLVRAAVISSLVFAAMAQSQPSDSSKMEKTVNGHATGSFDVTLTPQPPDGDPSISRMSLSKQLHGDLTGSSAGIMLSAGAPAKGSGGYIAMEKVNATQRHHGPWQAGIEH